MGCRNSSGQDIIEIVDILIKDFELLHKFVNGGSDETVLLGDPPDQEETATLRNLAMQIKWAIEYFLSQLQEVSDPFRYDSYAFNVRRSRKLEEPVTKGSIVTIPANYYPGRDILFVSVGGTVLTPKKVDDWDDGERQYEEVGDSPNIQSNKIRISFDLKAGDVIDVWVVASNLMREIATIAAMAQVATDKADEAKVSEETCKEILERIEKLVGTGILEMGVANIRIGWILDEHVDSGGILKLPTVYYPTRAVLLLSYKGTLCTPYNPRLGPSGAYQYEEIGNDPTVTSNQVRLHFEAWIGDEFDVWVCASAVGRNIEEIQAAKELACACAQQAEDIITNVGTSVLTQATFPVADNTVKAALDYLNPQTGEKSHVDIPIPLAVPPAPNVTGNAGLFPIQSYQQLETNRVLVWSPSKEYIRWSHAVGSDGERYVALAPSGPASGGAVNPVTDTANTKWRRDPENKIDKTGTTVLFVNYSAAQNGNGTAGAPFNTLHSCINYIQTIVMNPGFFQKGVWYDTGAADFYIHVSGPDTVVEPVNVQNSITLFNGVHIGIDVHIKTRWDLRNLGIVVLKNSHIVFGGHGTSVDHLTVILTAFQVINSYLYFGPDTYNSYVVEVPLNINWCFLSMSSQIDMYAHVRCEHAAGTPVYGYGQFFHLFASTVQVIGSLIMEAGVDRPGWHGVLLRSSNLYIAGGTSETWLFEFSNRNTNSLYSRTFDAQNSLIELTGVGKYGILSALLQKSYMRCNSGTMVMGNKFDVPCDVGFYMRDSTVQIESGINVATATRAPNRKGFMEIGSIFQSYGIARDSWPGVNGWTINTGSVYYE